MIYDIRHECDPSVSMIDLDKTLDFYCTRTCLNDGCNHHSVEEIVSNADEDLYKNNTLWKIYFLIWTQFYFTQVK
ncbi:unnamed protein product [Rotaria sordida]|uniref:Uncharacterized protein n=1 Tax=Rotaria sordida TaxID=392033 RepID=A0A815K7Q9_9BILA|nr:unnamed protein product [Rotaria sordida]CAF4129124.1 unnamed protein product [Rotaria sordida]CAF4195732.1 unnamed protein product [Rotaria sordida]